ncbi:hypothetical protein BGY98DRAFT_963746, partial [Russula aff. rugulosa BPL654]
MSAVELNLDRSALWQGKHARARTCAGADVSHCPSRNIQYSGHWHVAPVSHNHSSGYPRHHWHRPREPSV